MLKEFKSPNLINLNQFAIFLAGTIDMGNSINWQNEIVNRLDHLPINVFNPRRDDWNSEWKQSIDNVPFKEQVLWEMNAMNNANLIVFNFLPDSQSPVTLMELGLHANRGIMGEIIVCCPNEYWRSGNVHIICEEYGINLFKQFDELVDYLLNFNYEIQ